MYFTKNISLIVFVKNEAILYYTIHNAEIKKDKKK